MAEESQIRCLLLQLLRGVLLVPNAVVVEVLNNQLLDPAPASAPSWQVGQIEWREESELKIISFEGICGMSIPEVRSGANIVVMHSFGEVQNSRYYGIYVDEVPTFELVDETALTMAPDQSDNADCVASHVFVNGIEGYIPDLNKIASLL